jgi:hypothetical protein
MNNITLPIDEKIRILGKDLPIERLPVNARLSG